MVMSTRATGNIEQNSSAESDAMVESVRERDSPSNSTAGPEEVARVETVVENLEENNFAQLPEIITPAAARIPLSQLNDSSPVIEDNRKAPPPAQSPAPPAQLEYNTDITHTHATANIEQQAYQQLRQLRTQQAAFHRQANQPRPTINNPAPPPHTAGNNPHLLNMVKAPRIGGVYQGKEAWVGGSNLLHKRRQSPKGILCRRPMDLKQALVINKECQEGLISKYKLTAGDEKNMHNVKITDWIEHCRKAIELRGMDTVFRVLSSRGTQETYLLKDWAATQTVDIPTWLSYLDTCDCEYDETNLEWSGTFLMHSISDKLAEDVENVIGNYAPGPMVLQEIIKNKQQVDAMGRRKLEADLQGLKLSDQPCENVLEFSKKVRTIALKLDNIRDSYGNPLTSDLSAMVAETFTSCSVEMFRNKAQELFLLANTRPHAIHWRDIIKDSVNLYRAIETKWEPAQIKKPADKLSQLTSQIETLTAQLNKLELKGRGNNDNSSNNNNNNNNNADGTPSNNANGGRNGRRRRYPPHIPPFPKEGESHVTTFKEKEWWFCPKCRNEKGAWHKVGSPKAHKEADHNEENNFKINNLVVVRPPKLSTIIAAPIMAAESTTSVIEQDDDSIGTYRTPSPPLTSTVDNDRLDQLGRLSMNQLMLDEMDFDITPYIPPDEDDDSDSEDEDIMAFTQRKRCPIKQEAMRGMSVLKNMKVDELDKKHKGSVVFDESENQYKYFNQSKW